MTMIYNWQIMQLKRHNVDGFVNTVEYCVSVTDGEHSVINVDSVPFAKRLDASYTPFDELTKEQVVEWVQEVAGKHIIEASLARQLEAKKHPTEELGMPWGDGVRGP